METVKMKTGLGTPNDLSLNIKTFILCFMAIIWRRVWITALIYCNHNKIEINRTVILKSLKYNIFSNAGIGYGLKPYIKEALTVGFLMPKTVEKNIYATRAVNLYKLAYEIVKLGNKNAEIKFIHDYMMTVFSRDKKSAEKIKEESIDTIDIIDDTNDTGDTNNTGDTNDNTGDDDDLIFVYGKEKHTCKLCTIVDSWDITINLLYSNDPYQNILMKGLMNTLNN